jgi:hypothetical protein
MSGTRPAVATLAAAMLAVGGCGGSSHSSPTAKTASSSSRPASTTVLAPIVPRSSPPLARTELTRKANAICRRIGAQINLIKARSAAEFDLGMVQAAAYERTLYAELSKLAPPASLAGPWSQMIGYARTLAEGVIKVTQYPNALDNASVRPLFASIAQAKLLLHASAKRVGLTSCARY